MRVKRANRTPPRTDCGRARQKGRNYRYAGAVSCDVSQQADLTDYVDVEQVSDCVGICSAGQSRGRNAIAPEAHHKSTVRGHARAVLPELHRTEVDTQNCAA